MACVFPTRPLPRPSEMSDETGSGYRSQEHTGALIDNIGKLRMAAGYTDVVINVEGRTFPCHKVILAAGSPYFQSMFASGMEESRKNTIDIHQIDSAVFEYVIEFIYSGSIHITAAIVQELFTQAHLFQLSTLVELCTRFFEDNVCDGNCLAAMMLADTHAHKPLYDFAKEYACQNFTTVMKDDDFSKLSVECVMDLLRDRRLNCHSEELVFDAGIQWLEYNMEHRRKYRYKVLECVKFPHIMQNYLMDVVAKSTHVTSDEKGRELLEDAILFYTIPARRHQLPSYQITPRFSFPYFETSILLGGRLMDGLSNDVECYRTDTKEFTSLKQLPFKKRNEFAACAVGDEIYVSGGLRSSEFWKYDHTFETWLRGANMMHARRRHAMAAVDGDIYVIGGFDEDAVLGSIEVWHSNTNTWEEAGRLITAVENMGYVAFDQKIYLFGGKNSEEVVTNTVQCFDTVTHVCVELTNTLPVNDMCLSAVVLNGQIYVVGLEGVFRYSPQSDSWDVLPNMSCARDFVSLAVLDERLFTFGGRRRGAKDNLYTDVIESYDPKLNAWEVVGVIPVPMYSYGCVKILLSNREHHTHSH